MKDFLNRTITLEESILNNEDGNKMVMAVHRMRTSAGHASISATFNGQRVEFNVVGDYEEHARKFAEMILKVVAHPCSLPKVK